METPEKNTSVMSTNSRTDKPQALSENIGKRIVDEEADEVDEDKLIEQRRLKRQRLLEQLAKSQPAPATEDAANTAELPPQPEHDQAKSEHVAKKTEAEKADEEPDTFDSDEDDMFADSATVGGERKPKKLDKTMLDNWDDHEGYYRIIGGELIGGRYEVRETLGRGVFAAVVRALDSKTGNLVAIKIIRNNETMAKAALKEEAILRKLNEHDAGDTRHVVRLIDSFDHKNHLCLVFENLNSNLRSVLKKFGRDVGISIRAIRSYTRQMLAALELLRECEIVHADIKPDNILVADDQKDLKLADLGSASNIEERDIAPYLVSRYYRAPELILGIKYDYAVDMWSLACTLYELYQGHILFPGESNNEMLQMHMAVQGKPSHKLIRRGQYGSIHFNDELDFVSVKRSQDGSSITRTVKIAGPTATIRQKLAGSEQPGTPEYVMMEQFADLLDKMLVQNPEKRIDPARALRHPFLSK